MNWLVRYWQLLKRELHSQLGRLAMISVSVMLGVFSLTIFFAFGEGFSRFYRQVERDLPGSNQLRFSTDYWRVDGEWISVPGASRPLPLDLQQQIEQHLGHPVNLRTSQMIGPDGRPILSDKSLFAEVVFPGAGDESAGGANGSAERAPDESADFSDRAAPADTTMPESEAHDSGEAESGSGEANRPDEIDSRLDVSLWRDGNLSNGITQSPELGRLPEVGEPEMLMVYPREGEQWRVRNQPPSRFLGAEVTLTVPYFAVPDLRLLNHPALLPDRGEWLERERVSYEIVGVTRAVDTDRDPSFVPDFNNPAHFPSADLYMSESTMADLVERVAPQMLVRQLPPNVVMGENSLQPVFGSIIELKARGYLSDIELDPITDHFPSWRDYANFRVEAGEAEEDREFGSWYRPWLQAEDETLARLSTAGQITKPRAPDYRYDWQPWFPVSAAMQVENLSQVRRASEFLTQNYHYRVFDIFDKFKPLRRLGIVIRTLTAGIGIVALIISVLGITAVLVMAVAERTRQIGISRAVGATGRDILQVYLGQAAVVGLVALVPGFFLARWTGDLVDRYLNQLITTSDNFRDFLFGQTSIDIFRVDGELFLVVALVTLAACLIAALFPALRAARLETVDALRHE